MTIDEIIRHIWDHRKEIFNNHELTDNDYILDRSAVESTVRELSEQGWSPRDIIRYTQSLEYVDPTLDEDIALKRMAEISARYRKK